ncbi:transglutaminase-like domain-containing protein [Fulvivirgaceae bacterium PWU5]|uniref:Transglutaminase-like domain-containing protein n=1 Tax=Dawidia cretensis TaxID=2782350 RepID=A0AAP2DTD9_9BACT|nr:DUF3857 domain-containing protein [Dawidia cretensis]MBT1706926.1 transglutaminase-like domain-containing protein [Dawidia cretensis]
MKALIFGLHLALLAPLCAVAQKSPVKFGEIPMDDMTMKTYTKDSSASAVILSDYGEAYITFTAVDANLSFERHVRIKILKKDGFDLADVEIPLYHEGTDEERVSKLKATTYNLENGKIVETDLSKDGIFKEKFNRNINLQKFTFPNVKEGSVLEYSYTLVSEFITNFPDWQFQYDVPVRRSEYWALFPEYFTFQKYMQGYIAPTVYEVKSKNNTDFRIDAHHWVTENVPAFKEEPFMTCKSDYVSKINLALSHITIPGQPIKEIMGTWQKLNTTLLESDGFGKTIAGSGFLKKKAEELTVGMTDPQQKVAAIFSYVQKSLEWNGTKDMYADNLKTVFENKKGTAADINLALASMLEKLDIPVDMVLLSTRDHGFVREQYPMASQFNYAVCSVTLGDKALLLDATDRFLPMGILPERCLNGQGLVISKTKHGWILIQPKAKARTVVNTELVLNPTGELKGKVKYTHEGYAAREFRQAYFAKGEQEYVKGFLADKTWEVESSEFQNQAEVSQSVNQLHALNINEHATVAGNMIYMNPFVVGQTKENIFKLEAREYPVDFGKPMEKTYLCRITLPDGYAVEELPKPRVIMLPNNAGKYTYSATQSGNQLNIVSMLQINKSLFVMDEYPHLREFYNQLVAKQAEQIVLKKL